MNEEVYQYLRSKSLLRSVFAAVISLFVIVYVSNYIRLKETSNSSKWVMHSYKVQMDLREIQNNFNNLAANSRAYILNNDSNYLYKYLNHKTVIINDLTKLNATFLVNDLQAIQLKKLQKAVLIKTAKYDSINNVKPNVSAANVNDLKGFFRKMEADNVIDEQIAALIAIENKFLTTKKNDFENKMQFTTYFSSFLFLFSIIILTFAYVRIDKDFSSLKAAYNNLSIASHSMTQSEIIGEFGTWIWDLTNNTFKYSDNVFNLLGLPPQSFTANVQNFMDFVHPDDKPMFIEKVEKAMVTGLASNISFRVVRKDGVLRYFNSIGKTVQTNTGNTTIIGVTRDITNQFLISKSLEDRNNELISSNAELESFNQVASHDLQEPLRKIQLFISRISPDDINMLSESGKTYISKISSATTRMRILIDDLLVFSQAYKGQEFIKTDLNDLIQNALKELSIDITEKNVNVKIPVLPELEVIPFQIQQLFINLIQNAIKYSRPDSRININITCEKVNSKTSDIEIKNSLTNDYYKISFIDNGIGFDNEHAVAIFSMFKRLHTIDEYTGTGIGLAICKKIAENHNGAINASGTPNEGAIFNVFLPA